MAANDDVMRLVEQQAREKQLQAYLKRNMAYAKPNWEKQLTTLPPEKEQAFLSWVKANKVPFNPKDKIQDYDMRGFYQAMQNKDPMATNAVDPYDKKLHYPDYWKTPYHETFSKQSQWATEGAPNWNDKDQLVTPTGEVVFDPRKQSK